jgi:hypothetical protein
VTLTVAAPGATMDVAVLVCCIVCVTVTVCGFPVTVTAFPLATVVVPPLTVVTAFVDKVKMHSYVNVWGGEK